MRRRPRGTARRVPQHTTTGSHWSPVRPLTGQVARAAHASSIATATATPAPLGCARSTSTPINNPSATVRIWPARQPARTPPRSLGPKR